MAKARVSPETAKAWEEWRRKQKNRQPAESERVDTDATARRKEREKRVQKGCTIVFVVGALLAAFGLYAACQSCLESPPTPAGCSRGGWREYTVWEEAEKRREALEDRARGAIGLERELLLDEVRRARAVENAAERVWQRCMGR